MNLITVQYHTESLLLCSHYLGCDFSPTQGFGGGYDGGGGTGYGVTGGGSGYSVVGVGGLEPRGGRQADRSPSRSPLMGRTDRQSEPAAYSLLVLGESTSYYINIVSMPAAHCVSQ